MGIEVYLEAFSLTGWSLLPVFILASCLCIHTLGTASREFPDRTDCRQDGLGSPDCRVLIFIAEAEAPGGWWCQVTASPFKMAAA